VRLHSERLPVDRIWRKRLLATVMEGVWTEEMRSIIPADRIRALPLEIQSMIFERLYPCSYLTVIGQTRRLIRLLKFRGPPAEKEPHRAQFEVALVPGKFIYLQLADFQGVPYLSKISDTPPEKKTSHSTTTKVPIDAHVKMLVDHIGIRGFFILGNDKPLTTLRSDALGWSKTVRHRDKPLDKLICQTDVSIHGQYIVTILANRKPRGYLYATSAKHQWVFPGIYG
jgi:hypothetical protein